MFPHPGNPASRRLHQTLARLRGTRGWGIRRLLEGGLNIIAPPACLACRAPTATSGALCADCWRRLDFIESPACPRSGRPLAYLDDVVKLQGLPELIAQGPWENLRAAVAYGGVAKSLVRGLKYHDRHELARLMASLMSRRLSDLLAPGVLVIPVPLHPRRLWQRRFNQSALLAAQLAKKAAAAYAPRALRRVRVTTPQARLSGPARRRNMRGAFRVPDAWRPRLEGRHILLVDDVLTTGATATACCQALRKARPARLDVAVFALAGGNVALHK